MPVPEQGETRLLARAAGDHGGEFVTHLEDSWVGAFCGFVDVTDLLIQVKVFGRDSLCLDGSKGGLFQELEETSYLPSITRCAR